MTDILSADVYTRILDADLTNILRKSASGKPLSPAEHARVVAKAAGCNDTTTLAKTVVELATLLGTNRRQIARWQKLKGAPPANPNGSHDVVAWREFVRERGLKASNVSSEVDFAALKARKTLAEIEEREIKVAIKKGEYVPLSQVRREWMTQVGKARALFDARFLNELPPILVGKDAVAIRRELERSIFEIYEALHSGGPCTP
jgi:lysophospholipase L1-like esterase